MRIQTIKKYQTSLSFLARTGLVGQCAVIESSYPSQKDIRNSDPIKAFDDFLDLDFDPIENEFNNQLKSLENANTTDCNNSTTCE